MSFFYVLPIFWRRGLLGYMDSNVSCGGRHRVGPKLDFFKHFPCHRLIGMGDIFASCVCRLRVVLKLNAMLFLSLLLFCSSFTVL